MESYGPATNLTVFNVLLPGLLLIYKHFDGFTAVRATDILLGQELHDSKINYDLPAQNAYRSGGRTAQRFDRPAPSGAHCRYLLLTRTPDFRVTNAAVAHAKATAEYWHQENCG